MMLPSRRWSTFGTIDNEGMVGFTPHVPRRPSCGFDAVNPERFPWLSELKQAPWSGVFCLGMGGSAAQGAISSQR